LEAEGLREGVEIILHEMAHLMEAPPFRAA